MMFAPTAVPMPTPVVQYLYNKCEQLDGQLPGNQFVASEGTYRATEEITLVYPALHATEIAPNPNPLTPYAAPLTSGMHISAVTIDGSVLPTAVHTPLHGDVFNFDRSGESENTEDDESSDAENHFMSSQPTTPRIPPDGLRESNGYTSDMTASMTASVFDSNYDPTTKRKKRVGTSANGTTSSFISRAITDSNLGARLYEHKPGDVYIFANVQRCLSWLDLGASPLQKHEPLSRLMFSLAHVVCHDVNHLTKCSQGLDVVIGTTTGDIVWYDPMTTRYLRYNKQRCINSTTVTHIQWLPGSSSLFMAAHADGSLVIYDKDREDVDFASTLQGSGEGESFSTIPSDSKGPLAILKSAHEPRSKNNPVSYLNVSRQTINAFAISPDQVHVAVACDDGLMKIIDYKQEKLLDVYSSYYGGLTCVAWSPDGQYILTGGKDDLVSIWSFVERRIIARCHGHSSFITGVVFDNFRCDNFNYRFGSIAQDGKLCLWDFALSSLHKPSSKAAKSGDKQMPEEAHRPVITNGNEVKEANLTIDGVVYHEVESRLSTAILSPITMTIIDDQPPSHLMFLQDHLMTVTLGRRCGRIRMWKRPDEESDATSP